MGLSLLTEDINRDLELNMTTLSNIQEEVLLREHLPPGVTFSSFKHGDMMKHSCDE